MPSRPRKKQSAVNLREYGRTSGKRKHGKCMGSLSNKRWAKIREAGAVNVADDIDDPTVVSPAVREGDDAPPQDKLMFQAYHKLFQVML